jgi:hypothetical protein
MAAVGWILLATWVIALLVSPFSIWRAWHRPMPYPATRRQNLASHVRAQQRALLPQVLMMWTGTGLVLCEGFAYDATGWKLEALRFGFYACLVLSGASLALAAAVVRLNRPRWLVPPSMRDEGGLTWEGWRYWVSPTRWFR